LKVELLQNAAITERLSGYWRVKIADEIPSTQSELKKLNPINWDLLAAEFQSAGRGRLDRTFEAAKSASLLFSFYIEPKRNKNDWGFIPLIAGASTASVINKLSKSDKYSCKWPNDILAEDKKIAGLLAETFGQGVIIGIGINVTLSGDDLPTPFASSILIQSGITLDRNFLLAEICNEFRERFEEWDSGADLTSYYSNLSATLNKKVRVIQPSGELSGVAAKISASGSLILDSGEEVTVGDLLHLRD
jgi:BirA family biotin operon repressor/biotin-[acetyl-CoA-carboxylase] ligase